MKKFIVFLILFSFSLVCYSEEKTEKNYQDLTEKERFEMRTKLCDAVLVVHRVCRIDRINNIYNDIKKINNDLVNSNKDITKIKKGNKSPTIRVYSLGDLKCDIETMREYESFIQLVCSGKSGK